jgi:Skp family chaperone for outer membrane proteins
MKNLLLAGAVMALSATIAAPASAQVGGIGVSDPALVIASSAARTAAYTQISQTFAAQRTQLEQSQEQLNTLLRPFDTDQSGQLDDTERAALLANATAAQQVQTLEQTIQTTQSPITAARVYAIEQIAQQLSPAVEQVVTANSVQLILPPTSVVYMSDAVDLTDEIVAALNSRVPSVSTAVPQGWQPQRSTVDLFQQVQQILLSAAVMQAQQEASQQPPAAPAVQGR